jgi:hypothetical protein
MKKVFKIYGIREDGSLYVPQDYSDDGRHCNLFQNEDTETDAAYAIKNFGDPGVPYVILVVYTRLHEALT